MTRQRIGSILLIHIVFAVSGADPDPLITGVPHALDIYISVMPGDIRSFI